MSWLFAEHPASPGPVLGTGTDEAPMTVHDGCAWHCCYLPLPPGDFHFPDAEECRYSDLTLVRLSSKKLAVGG